MAAADETTIPAPVGKWWLDEGQDSGVWPCEVLSANIFGVEVRPTLGPNEGKTFIVPVSRVYDSAFNRPGRTPRRTA